MNNNNQRSGAWFNVGKLWNFNSAKRKERATKYFLLEDRIYAL